MLKLDYLRLLDEMASESLALMKSAVNKMTNLRGRISNPLSQLPTAVTSVGRVAALAMMLLYPQVLMGATADEEGITSVIQVIGESTESFEDVMEKKLGTNVGRHRDQLRNYIKLAEQDLTAISRDPKNEKLRLDYEDHLSRGLEAGNNMLNEMLSAKDDILKEVGRVRSSVKNARKVFDRAAKADAKERAEAKRRVEKIEKTLREFAAKHRDTIESGGELPAEVREPIRMLENELSVEKTIAGFHVGANTKEVLAGLQDYEQQLDGMEEDMRVAFDKADKQKRLVGKIADLRRRGMYVGMLAKETESLRNTVKKYQGQIRDLDGWTDQLVKASSGSMPKLTKTTRIARSKATNKFLSQYLNEPGETSLVNTRK